MINYVASIVIDHVMDCSMSPRWRRVMFTCQLRQVGEQHRLLRVQKNTHHLSGSRKITVDYDIGEETNRNSKK